MGGFGLVNVASLTASGYITTYSSMSVAGVLNAGSIYTAGVSSFTNAAFFTGVSSFSNAANIHVAGGSAGQVLSKVAGGGMQWSDVASMVSGDNLGTHIATRTLDMASFDLVRVSSVNFRANVFLTSATAANYGGLYTSTHVYTTGNIYAARFLGDVSGATGLPAGDNLGNHTATNDLKMQNFGIIGVSTISASGIYISSYGVVQTTGVGLGTVVGNARGSGAVDLQSFRSATDQVAGGNYSVLSGGRRNKASGNYTVIGGGEDNLALGGYSTVAGGSDNVAGSGSWGDTVSGGQENIADGGYSVVAGGYQNIIGNYSNSVISGGAYNRINQGSAVVAGGESNAATGSFSFVAGGHWNTANGSYSFAAGRASSSAANGSFTWADSEGADTVNSVPNRTMFKNRGGFMVTGSTNTHMTGVLNRGVLITGSGLVGIATGTPQAALDIVSTGTAANVYAQIWRNSSGIVVASMTSVGGLYAAVNTKVQAANTGITVTSADFGKTITVNSASNQIVTLPGVTAADIGATITIVKLGAGRVTIQAAASTYIADSSAGGTLFNNAAAPAYASVTLVLVAADRWMLVAGAGAWITT